MIDVFPPPLFFFLLRVCARWRPTATLSELLCFLLFSPHSVSLLARLVNTDAIMHSIIHRIEDECLPWLVSISIIGQQLYLKNSSHSWQLLKVSRGAAAQILELQIGGKSQRGCGRADFDEYSM